MNPEIANAIAGFANATNTLFDVLIRTLDQHRMIDKQRFRQTSYCYYKRNEARPPVASEIRSSSILKSSNALG
jgi:hypothetical protein